MSGSDPLAYYAAPGPLTTLTDAAVTADLLSGLPSDLPALIPALAESVQGNLLHIFWAGSYGVTLSEERKAEVQIRTATERLRRIHAADPAPLTTARDVDKRLVGNCRDFSVLTVALLRHQGIPARARCGFGTYFIPDHYEDHWIVEYWNGSRWVQADIQLDTHQCDKLGITFDTLDMPPGQFVTGGQAWLMCRQQGADPDQFGIFDMKGLWFIAGNLLRDLAALNKMELLPWDSWGVVMEEDYLSSDDTLTLLDRAAALSLVDNTRFGEMQAFYAGNTRLCVPPVIASYSLEREPVPVTLAGEPGIVLA